MVTKKQQEILSGGSVRAHSESTPNTLLMGKLQVALKDEHEAVAMYKDMARQFGNAGLPGSSDVLMMIAEQEAHHATLIESLMANRRKEMG